MVASPRQGVHLTDPQWALLEPNVATPGYSSSHFSAPVQSSVLVFVSKVSSSTASADEEGSSGGGLAAAHLYNTHLPVSGPAERIL